MGNEAAGFRSRVFLDLWLVVDGLLAGNMVQVLAVLQAGLIATEHMAFGQTLAD
jgi:hypothetical protein